MDIGSCTECANRLSWPTFLPFITGLCCLSSASMAIFSSFATDPFSSFTHKSHQRLRKVFIKILNPTRLTEAAISLPWTLKSTKQLDNTDLGSNSNPQECIPKWAYLSCYSSSSASGCSDHVYGQHRRGVDM